VLRRVYRYLRGAELFQGSPKNQKVQLALANKAGAKRKCNKSNRAVNQKFTKIANKIVYCRMPISLLSQKRGQQMHVHFYVAKYAKHSS
jgi:late competence protein required for DNA uptake (superfamily II DNA/RNA helicase)